MVNIGLDSVGYECEIWLFCWPSIKDPAAAAIAAAAAVVDEEIDFIGVGGGRLVGRNTDARLPNTPLFGEEAPADATSPPCVLLDTALFSGIVVVGCIDPRLTDTDAVGDTGWTSTNMSPFRRSWSNLSNPSISER